MYIEDRGWCCMCIEDMLYVHRGWCCMYIEDRGRAVCA